MNKKVLVLTLACLSSTASAKGLFEGVFDGVDFYAGVGYKQAEFNWGIDNTIAGSPDTSMLNWTANVPELALTAKTMSNEITLRYAASGTGEFFDEDFIHDNGGNSTRHYTESDVEYTAVSLENMGTLYRFGKSGGVDEVNFLSFVRFEYEKWLAMGLYDHQNNKELYDSSEKVIEMDVFSLTALYGLQVVKRSGNLVHDFSALAGVNAVYAVDSHLKRTDLADDSFEIALPYGGLKVGYTLDYLIDCRSTIRLSAGYEHYWAMGDTVNVSFTDGKTGHTGLDNADEGSWTIGIDYRLNF